jgi:Uma2 family endonuclease
MSGKADRRNDDMTVAPERPCPPAPVEQAASLIEIAEMAAHRLPGHKVEILGGRLIVTPPPDGPHGEALTGVTLAFAALHRGETRVIQGMGVWLPTGDDDHAVPDLAIVDADYREHEVEYRCYDPAVFRLVLEITSSDWRDDLGVKPRAYARAGIPVYVIGDRKHHEVVVYTDPRGGEYTTQAVHKPGKTFTLPAAIGSGVELETDALLLR